MEAPSKETTLKLKSETLEKLKTKKTEVKAKSMDALLQWLLREELAQEAPVPAEKPEQDENPGAQKRRKIFVAEPLYSMEALRQRRGMFEYLTSFDEAEIQLLIKRFSEVLLLCFFFRFLRFGHVASSRALVVTSQ
jgi:hypothetical protein